MYISLKSYTLYGLEAVLINVEVNIAPGLPKFEIIGLPDPTIRESRERIFQSILRYGYEIPPGNITINLAPAEIKKKGSVFDLPIAAGMLLASRQITAACDLNDIMIAGELSLNGEIKKINGVFNAGYTCFQKKINSIILPVHNYNEIKHFKNLNIVPVNHLIDAVNFIKKQEIKTISDQTAENDNTKKKSNKNYDFNQVYGNENAKRAIQLALTAKLNILLIGPPGCGKTMLIQRIPTLFSKLESNQSMNVSRIYSAGGHLENKLIEYPPFRQVHNTITDQALFGGGHYPVPGEISLAHKGILFFDEMAEFNKNQIQMMRQPMENKNITINRMYYTYNFPCDFMLAAATNPCPCGYYGDTDTVCRCSPNMLARYYTKISGPILDRIEIILYIHPPESKHMFARGNKSSSDIKNEIFEPKEFIKHNHDYLSENNIRNIMNEDNSIKMIIREAYEKKFISLRRVKAILKTALTIALFDKKKLNDNHVFEAIELCRFKWDSFQH